MTTTWFQMKVAADPTLAEVYINDRIGSWDDRAIQEWTGVKSSVTAKQIIDELAALPDSVEVIHLHLNSPGGDVSAALMIANAFRDQRAKGREVITIVDGLAASAASIVAMAGSPVRMSDNAIMMIHNPWCLSLGDAEAMRKTADVLDQIRDGSIIPTYQWHSKLSAAKITALLDAETWMDCDDAIANGFAEEKIEGLQAVASIDARAIASLNVPERFADRVKALLRPESAGPAPVPTQPPPPPAAPIAAGPTPASGDRVFRECIEAGLDVEFAHAAIAARVTPEDLAKRITAEKSVRAAAETRATHIRLLFKNHHPSMADMAQDLIDSALPFDRVKRVLATVAAKLDKVEIDAGLSPHGHPLVPAAKKLDSAAIYAELNKPIESRG